MQVVSDPESKTFLVGFPFKDPNATSSPVLDVLNGAFILGFNALGSNGGFTLSSLIS